MPPGRGIPRGAESIAAWLVNDFTRLAGSDENADPDRLGAAALADLVRAVDTGVLSHRQGRTVLAALLARGGSFEEARAAADLTEIGDEATLRALLRELARGIPRQGGRLQGGADRPAGVLRGTGDAADRGARRTRERRAGSRRRF